MVGWAEMPRSPGHVFYDRLQSVLIRGRFRRLCRGGLSVPITRPGWGRLRCRRGAISACTWWATSRASTLSAGWNGAARIPCRYGSFYGWKAGIVCRTIPGCHGPARRLPHEVHTAIFDWVLALIAEAGLVKGERIGVDASTMEANAALRNIVREGHGRGLPGDAGALGPGERHRDTHGRGPGAPGPQAQGQEALEPGTGSRRATPRPRSPR